MQDTRPLLLPTDFPPIRREGVRCLQVNLGYRCNLSCTHCHVNAGPTRSELMDREAVDLVLDVLASGNIESLDLTGGAPEMNPHFRYLVSHARKRNIKVIDRCNLTILLEPGFEWLVDFLAGQKVSVVASLPCFSEQNVDQQRGKGVFAASIEALQRLNAAGYGRHPDLELSLVYNPGGAFLPPAQDQLKQQYQQKLRDEFGVVFNELLTIANMPINRFGAVLLAKGNYAAYMSLLKDNYCADNLNAVMCRSTISVGWQGYLYDCDFNQMLDMPIAATPVGQSRLHLRHLLSQSFDDHPIAVAEHCYGCTAGQGSSCGGALGR